MKATHSPFEVELFSTRGQWIIFICICVLVLVWSLFEEYRRYAAYSAPEGTQEIYAQVIAQYMKEKNGTSYYVFKLKGENGEVFYSTSKEDIKDITYRFVRIYGKRGDCSFVEYLRSCFFITYYMSLQAKRDYRDTLRRHIEDQHHNPLIASLYKTLFIADFLPKVWRDLSNKLGIAHLIAISGFHLGVLSFVIGGCLNLIYKIFHTSLSYRNKYFDIALCVLICLFIYLLILDFSPSFLRAFVMAVCGFCVVYSGIKLISFKLLFVVVCLCLALFPRLIFSIGFFLSVGGVFFIYLFMSHIHIAQGFWHKFLYIPFLFNALIFIDMLPFVHWFFPYFTPLCVLSVPLSLLFVVFFPFMLIAHICGFGFVCDEFLSWALTLRLEAIEFYTPWWFMGIFTLCALAGIYSKKLYFVLQVLGVGFFAYMVFRYFNLS